MIYKNSRFTVCAIFLLISVSDAAALTLEKFRGSIVLGRPLDFKVQANLGPNEELAALCLETEVFQAETLINPARVNIQLLKSNSENSSTVRVSSSAIVDEPILTVVIKYGCSSKNFRRYVVFADPPSNNIDAAQAYDTAPIFAPSQSVTFAPAKVSPPTVAKTMRIVRPARTRQTTATAANASAQSRLLGSSMPTRNTKPRLQLDGIEPSPQLTTRLKSTLELLTTPSELSSAQRTEAAALWRVVSPESEDLSQERQRVTALQGELLNLRNRADKSDAEISRLSAQLKEAESSKYQNPLMYGLLATLVLLIASVAFLRWGLKSDIIKSVWWKSSRDKSKTGETQNFEDKKKTSFSNAVSQQPDPLVPLSTVSSINPAAERRDPEIMSDLLRFKSSDSAYTLLGASNNARGVSVEELFDIQQQADFFISLGQYDQAIEVLQGHIRDNVQTSPLIFLDLLKLYHLTMRKTEYRDLTVEFAQLFNADVPMFDAFRDQTRGLEAYQTTLALIVSVWHTDVVLKVIEDFVFRQPGRFTEALDLEAHRELLLLHSIAKDLSESKKMKADAIDQASQQTIRLQASAKASALQSGIFNQTIPQKLALVIDDGRLDIECSGKSSGEFQKPSGSLIGLDIDLTAGTPRLSFYELTVAPEDAKKITVNREEQVGRI